MKVLPTVLFLCVSIASTASAVLELEGELLPYKEKRDPGQKATAPAGMKAGYGPRPISQTKVLSVKVRNASSRFEPGITVRYWIIGKDPKNSKPALLDGGESQVNLKPNGVEVVTSEPVKTTYTPPSVFKQPGAKAAPEAPKVSTISEDGKAVVPQGLRISGFAIQAIRDGKVIAENVQDMGVKKLIGSEGKEPGPLFSVDRPEKEQN
jgi:hypothetical protein